MSDAARKLAELNTSTKSNAKQDKTYVPHRGTVASVSGKTAYVVLDGSEGQTPCSMSMNCKVGDRVVVHIYDHSARVTGNLSAPATDDTVANAAATTAESAHDLAEEAAGVANATKQHFWTDENGTHVTEVTQEEFQEEPRGANQLSNANGTLLRDGETNLAQFTPSGAAFYDGQGNASANIMARFGATSAQVGKTSDMHATVDANGLRVYDAQGNLVSYFTASNARIGNNAGDYAVVNENGICFFKDSVLIGYCLGDSARLGTIAEGVKNVITNANGIYLRENTTNLASFTPDAITVGKTGTGQKNLYATSGGLYLRNGTTEIASFTPDTIKLGESDSATIELLGKGSMRFATNQATNTPTLYLETTAGYMQKHAITFAVSGVEVNLSHDVGSGSTPAAKNLFNVSVGGPISGQHKFMIGHSEDYYGTSYDGMFFGASNYYFNYFDINGASCFKKGLGLDNEVNGTWQNFTVTASNGADQLASLNFTCVNNANTAQLNDRFLLIPRNNGLGLYNSTDSKWMWNISNLDTATNTTATNVITGNTTNAEIQGARRALWGKMCQVYVNWKSKNAITVAASGDIATNVTIGTLTSVCRPAIYAMGISNGDDGGNGAMYDIATDGTVKLTACNARNAAYTIPAGTTFYMYALFIVP